MVSKVLLCKDLRWGEIVIEVICHLQTLFGTYEQFISVFWNGLFYWQYSYGVKVIMSQCTYEPGSL